jgi:hypothetical protein
MTGVDSESRRAFHDLLALLQTLDQTYLGSDWLVNSPADVAEGLRAVMHMLQGALVSYFEDDPDHPTFRRIVTPTRKFTGDNADTIYFDAPVRPTRTYRVRGNVAGADYVSLTVEAGAQEGRFGSRTAGAINDTEFDVGPDGSFEVYFGGAARSRNWLALPPDAARITTRHYYEHETPRAADTTPCIPLRIDVVGETLPAPAPPTDASVAAGIRRVINFVETRTLGLGKPGTREQPPFVSKVPNDFPPPVKPGDFALAAVDAAYSMAMYMIGPDQALVMRGRWPKCRFANVSLWNRHMQTFDYSHRRVSLNRKQTRLEPDGSFRMVIAHADPGVPNWLDTEGRGFGMVFWRFMLPEGAIETPRAEVVSWSELAKWAKRK